MAVSSLFLSGRLAKVAVLSFFAMPALADQVLTFPAVGDYNYYCCYTEHENGRLLA